MDQREDWRLTDALDYEQGRGDPFAAAVRATRMPMVITDPRQADNPIVFCNEAFQHLSGYDRHEIVGRNCRFLQGPDTDRAEVARIRSAIDRGTDVEAVLLNYRKDGSTFWNALYLSPVRDDSNEIAYFFASQLDVTERRLAEQRAIARREEVEREVADRTADLQRALEDKTMLLHELDHRVKNNLGMIGSLLRLQARSATDPAVVGELEGMLGRVDALSAVHRRLFQSAAISRFDLGAFLRDLAADTIGAGSGRITFVADIVPIEIAPSHAASLGVVLNEILLGCVARASAGRAGTLRIRAAVDGPTARIEFADDGPGLRDDAPEDFGRILVRRLSRQAGMAVEWSGTPNGTRISLSLPLEGVT